MITNLPLKGGTKGGNIEMNSNRPELKEKRRK